MSDDLYELQREQERDLQRELDSKQLDRDLFKLTLDGKRTQLETGLLQRRLDAPMGGSVREDILQWREELLQALGQREIEEDDWVARLATEDWQTQLEPLRKHAADFAELHLIDGVEQLYAEIARRAEFLQDLLSYQDESQRANLAVRARMAG
jgi:hypothetical protein